MTTTPYRVLDGTGVLISPLTPGAMSFGRRPEQGEHPAVDTVISGPRTSLPPAALRRGKEER
ncbi:hypothetical protein Dvina_18245 [Dactylosporangium vinaceum]|uniref:Aldo/keto reductase n=1 Tax=Dactylosporangium vinaceum TaxID=53362 RepID=A0ABV5M304_9ACTN|nr:hypothetical protein [Dactylosporangium vinaceum]UAB99825.1 hypothetical protein Dvina_18245 [Dactylosporangium vinaceum]